MRLVQRAGVVGATLGLALALCPASAQAARLPAPRWRIVYMSQVRNSGLRDVVATGRRSGWAHGTTTSDKTILLRWNGSRWRWVKPPGTASFEADSLNASGPDNVWLTGINTRIGGAVGFRFDGIAWHRVPMPPVDSSAPPVVLSPSNVWLYTSLGCTFNGATPNCATAIWHWDGQRWTSQVMNKIVGAMGGIRGHVWLGVLRFVRFSDGDPTGRLALYRLNGQAWQPMSFSTPRVAPIFNTITASSAKNLWVVAGGLVHRITARHSGVFHFNGRAWTELRGPIAESAQLFPVSLDGHGGIWLGPWAHWTGRRWVNAFPRTGFAGVDCFGINGLATIPGSTEVLAAGAGHRIGSARDQFNAMVLAYRSQRKSPGSTSPAPIAHPNEVTCIFAPHPRAETTWSRVRATPHPQQRPARDPGLGSSP